MRVRLLVCHVHHSHYVPLPSPSLPTLASLRGTNALGFIHYLHAIGPLPWKVDGLLAIKPSSFHIPVYITLVLYLAFNCMKHHKLDGLDIKPGIITSVNGHTAEIARET